MFKVLLVLLHAGKGSDDATILTEITSLSKEEIVNVACGSATSFAVSAKGAYNLQF